MLATRVRDCWRTHSVVWFCFTYACVDFPKASS
jgi:hypothetical protein